MKVFLLMLLIIDSNGNESLQKVSSHTTYLSCKVNQANYNSIKDKIIYYCSDKVLYNNNDINNKKFKH